MLSEAKHLVGMRTRAVDESDDQRTNIANLVASAPNAPTRPRM